MSRLHFRRRMIGRILDGKGGGGKDRFLAGLWAVEDNIVPLKKIRSS